MVRFRLRPPPLGKAAQTVTLLDQLRERRASARATAEAVLTRSAETGEPMTGEDLAEHARAVADAREGADAIEACRADHERALSVGTLTAGGHLVPAPLSSRLIDLARAQTRVFQAGAITVPMTSTTLKLARLTGEGTPGWKTENSAITANADLVFDSVTFTARTLTRVITMSVELLEDSDPSANDVIARSFAGQLAVELDRAALRGTGTPPEPRGILNQTGVTLT